MKKATNKMWDVFYAIARSIHTPITVETTHTQTHARANNAQNMKHVLQCTCNQRYWYKSFSLMNLSCKSGLWVLCLERHCLKKVKLVP